MILPGDHLEARSFERNPGGMVFRSHLGAEALEFCRVRNFTTEEPERTGADSVPTPFRRKIDTHSRIVSIEVEPHSAGIRTVHDDDVDPSIRSVKTLREPSSMCVERDLVL